MRAIIVNGMAFGDEGKGLATDFFVNKHNAKLVVRYNGGAQAAHNVVLPNGTHHTFSSFGSGTLRGAHTHLSRFTLVSLFALVDEYEYLVRKGFKPTISIDPRCVIVTPYHLIANQLREVARGVDRHGSVGVGIGEAREDEIDHLALRLEDFYDSNRSVIDILNQICQKKCDTIPGFDNFIFDGKYHAPKLSESMGEILDFLGSRGALTKRTTQEELAYESGGTVIFEGAQGVLLDEHFGTFPHNSWTDCTFRNADTLLKESSVNDYEKCGVFRTYFTRHGAGPFVTEDRNLALLEEHNKTHDFMGQFRVGHFDLVAAKYACGVSRPDYLFVTHYDKLNYSGQMRAIAYKYRNSISDLFVTSKLWEAQPLYEPGNPISELEVATNLPIRWVSHGPTSDDVAK